MQAKADAQLLREYAFNRSEAAFGEIVTRHTDLIYSAALRQVESPDLAGDIAQRVFTDLARKAKPLSAKLAEQGSLVGWLYRSTRYASLTLLRDERRRTERERQAMEQIETNSVMTEDWDRVRPLLDAAMGELNNADRDALLLRFFKNQNFREVGLALNLSDDSAQKRVSRALDKLRGLLASRGATTSAAMLSAVLSAKAVQVAPIGLAAGISTAALTASATGVAATLTATTLLAMTTLQKLIVAGVLTAAIGTGIYQTRQTWQLREEARTLREKQTLVDEQPSGPGAESKSPSDPASPTNSEELDGKAKGEARATDLASRLREALKLPDELRQRKLAEIALSVPISEIPDAVDLAIAILTTDADRIAFVAPLIQHWAENDPVTALDFVMNHPLSKANPDALEWFVGTILKTWAGKDPEAALAWVEALPDGRLKQTFSPLMLAQLAQSDPQKALARVMQMPAGRARDQLLQQIGSVLGSKDPKAAAELAKSLPAGSSRDQFLRMVVARWMDSDPQSAVNFILSMPASGSRDDLIRGAVSAWARTDPQAAAKFSETMPFNRMWGMTGVAYSWALKDPTAAWEWSMSITDDETRRSSLGGVLRCLATQSHLDEAAKFAAQLKGDDQVRAVRSLLIDASDLDPDWTSRWVGTFPAGETRNQAVEKLVQHWSMTDPVATAKWLLEQPRDQSFQEGARRLIPGMLKASPSAAWDWAMVLTDPAAKQQQLETVSKSWLASDPNAARAKIQASGLPPSQVSILLGP